MIATLSLDLLFLLFFEFMLYLPHYWNVGNFNRLVSAAGYVIVSMLLIGTPHPRLQGYSTIPIYPSIGDIAEGGPRYFPPDGECR